MSKYLIKILSICAFVILLPLVVVGAALCVTEAIGVKVTVAADGLEGGEGATSQVSIYIGGEKQEESTIVIKKNTEVTVTYEGTGYDFQGWYNGNYAEIAEGAKAVSDKESYTFLVRGNTVLTAVRNIKKYTITYAGKMDDGTTDVNVEPATQEYAYGEQLVDLAPVVAGRALTGWYVAGSETEVGAVATKVANFEQSGAYTVNPLWDDQMIVAYYKGAQFIHSDVVSSDEVATYQLLAGTDEKVVNVLTPGYSFGGWVDGANDVTVLPEYKVAGYTLQLKETLNNYVVSVKYHALSADTQDVSYNVVNGFGNYNVVRTGYTLQGFKYNNKVYAYDETAKDYLNDGAKLSTEVLAHDGLDVVAVWTCNYGSFTLSADGDVTYTTDTSDTTEVIDVSINFRDEANYYDLTDDVFEWYKAQLNNATVFYNGSNNAVVWNGDYTLSVGGVQINRSFSARDAQSGEISYTFAELIQDLNNYGGANWATKGISIEFEFVAA